MAGGWLVGLALCGAAGEVETIGDVVAVAGLAPTKVEGIGIVAGLQGAGAEPPPGPYREAALALMRKRDADQPTKLLQSKNVAVVTVRAVIPPGARKGDAIDVEVATVPGDQATKSLRGGYLLEAPLRVMATTGRGVTLTGAHLANAAGRIVVMDAARGDGEPQSGRALGGGKVLLDRDFVLAIDNGRRSVRLSKEIAARIVTRFPVRSGHALGPAEAKTDRQVELKPIPGYKYNLARYLLAIQRIPINLDERGRSERIARLKGELLEPTTSYDAALKLEALGPTAAPALAAALASPVQIVRFGAAEALCYLGDPRGVKELAACAENEPLCRAYALAALASNPLPVSGLRLVQLMQSQSVETRYGAFRALLMLDDKNPALAGEKLADEFWLHALPSRSEPLAHAARRHRQEIVIFGDHQKFMSPLLVRLGDRFVVQTIGAGDQLMLAKFVPGKEPERLEAPNNVADAVRAIAKLGAGYTDAVDLLRQAAEQNALEGRFEINALPKSANLAELAASGNGSGARQLPTGLPTLFQDGAEADDARAVRLRGEAPAGTAEAEPAKKPGVWRKLQFWRAN